MLNAFFDQPVGSVGLAWEAVCYLRNYGVRHVGEIPRFEWSNPGRLGIDRLFGEHHLLTSVDPWSLGWRPAYLRDPAVRATLMLPSTMAFRDRGVWDPHPLEIEWNNDCEVEMRPYVGQSIACLPKTNGRLDDRHTRTIQYALDPVPAYAAIHAAMHLPEDFADERGEETVPEVVAYRARKARACALYQAVFDRRDRTPPWDLQTWGGVIERRAEAECKLRSPIIAAALKAEGMSPHFFAVATRIDKVYFRKTKTVREFLSVPPGVLCNPGFGSQVPACLGFWGLNFGMTKEELDDLFGPEASAEGDAATA